MQKEGLFNEEFKKVVPNNAINIGVATSLQGAVLQDIKNVAYRRNAGVNLFVYGCTVQGTKADDTIIKAIQELDKLNLDVIIVARGGGSSEDLDCFNSEKLARIVFECKTPIVSAVGHETDFTIIDFVADKRAPTPSAAAEIVVSNVEEQKRLLLKLLNRMKISISRECVDGKRKAENFIYRINTSLHNYLEKSKQTLKMKKQLIDRYQNDLYVKNNNKFNLLCQALEKLNHLAVMRRGFAFVENENRIVCSKIADFEKGQNIVINVIDGKVNAEVREIEKGKRK